LSNIGVQGNSKINTATQDLTLSKALKDNVDATNERGAQINVIFVLLSTLTFHWAPLVSNKENKE